MPTATWHSYVEPPKHEAPKQMPQSEAKAPKKKKPFGNDNRQPLPATKGDE